jgi:pilus assembly protein Flp/PilA
VTSLSAENVGSLPDAIYHESAKASTAFNVSVMVGGQNGGVNTNGTGPMFATLTTLWKSEDGATAIEYGLIAALIAVAAIAAMQLVGTDLTSVFNNVASDL